MWYPRELSPVLLLPGTEDEQLPFTLNTSDMEVVGAPEFSYWFVYVARSFQKPGVSIVLLAGKTLAIEVGSVKSIGKWPVTCPVSSLMNSSSKLLIPVLLEFRASYMKRFILSVLYHLATCTIT